MFNHCYRKLVLYFKKTKNWRSYLLMWKIFLRQALVYIVMICCSFSALGKEGGENKTNKKQFNFNPQTSYVKPNFYNHREDEMDLKFLNWNHFANYIRAKEKHSWRLGWSYFISGAIGLTAATVALNSVNGPVEKVGLALFQNLEATAMGYGIYKSYIGSPDISFYNVIQSSAGLSMENKNQILKSYMLERKFQKERIRWIQFGTHSLLAITNILAGLNEKEDRSVRDALLIMGGLNLVASLTFCF